jgi:hypothetical protein
MLNDLVYPSCTSCEVGWEEGKSSLIAFCWEIPTPKMAVKVMIMDNTQDGFRLARRICFCEVAGVSFGGVATWLKPAQGSGFTKRP